MKRIDPSRELTMGQVAVALIPLIASAIFGMSVDKVSVDVALSFLILGVALSAQLLLAIRGRSPSPANASVFVFNLMFVFVAPIVQISVIGLKLVNTTYARPDLIIQTNLACSLFIASYLLARQVLASQKAQDFKPRPQAPDIRVTGLFTMATMLSLGLFITLFSVPFLGASMEDRGLTPILLAFRKFVFFIPTAMLLIMLVEYTRSGAQRSFVHVLLLIGLFLCVIGTENTGTDKRNALGPIYLSILFVLFRHKLRSCGWQVFWLVAILLVLFPFSSAFTHGRLIDVTWQSFAPSVISEHFLSVHYDAWANIYTSIEMVARNGASNGKQLLGAILFYVPSTWWSGKPLATGIEIGNYLELFYTMWFTNLSAPLVAEAFLDFGFIGVAAYGAALAGAVRVVEKMTADGRNALAQAMSIYAAFFLVFLLRGSLMIAVAYGSGALLAFVVSWGLMRMLGAVSAARVRVRPGLASLSVPAAIGAVR